MKRSSWPRAIPFLLVVLLLSDVGCSAAQRAHAAEVVDRAIPALRQALGYITAALGMIPQNAAVASARVIVGAAGSALAVYEQTRAAPDHCRAWVALYGALEHSAITMDGMEDVPNEARITTKRASSVLLGIMPSTCRDADAIMGESPGTRDGGTLDDAGNAVQPDASAADSSLP